MNENLVVVFLLFFLFVCLFVLAINENLVCFFFFFVFFLFVCFFTEKVFFAILHPCIKNRHGELFNEYCINVNVTGYHLVQLPLFLCEDGGKVTKCIYLVGVL